MKEERRYVSLGHDALAKIVADWDEEFSRGARLVRRLLKVAAALLVCGAVVMTLLTVWALHSRSKAQEQTKIADIEKAFAQDAEAAAKETAEKTNEQLERQIDSAKKLETEVKDIIALSAKLDSAPLDQKSTLAHELLEKLKQNFEKEVTDQVALLNQALEESKRRDKAAQDRAAARARRRRRAPFAPEMLGD